jgi:hypothetical protein
MCPDGNTDVTSSVLLAVIAQYCICNEAYEELINLINSARTATGADVCKAVVNALNNAEVDLTKIVSVTTDDAPTNTGREAGFVTLLTKYVGHPSQALE